MKNFIVLFLIGTGTLGCAAYQAYSDQWYANRRHADMTPYEICQEADSWKRHGSMDACQREISAERNRKVNCTTRKAAWGDDYETSCD